MSPDPSAPADPAARALHRLAFLARAGELLASSLDYDETLRHVARLALPELGDLCVVDIVEDGGLRRLATEHVRPEKQALVEAMSRINPDPSQSPAPAGRVLASGETERLDVVTPDVVASHTRDDAHARLIREIGIRSHLAVPMRAHGQVIGVLSLGITESDRRYDDEDQQLAEELARRAALAVENARLYRAVQGELARREQAEAALRLSEQRFRAILEQSPLSTQRLGPDGRTLGVNRAFERLWGVTLDALEGYSVLDDPQLEEKGIAPLLRRAFEGTPTELPVIAYDVDATLPGASTHADTVRWIGAFAYPVRDDAGEIREVVLVHDDVTDTHRAQRQLRESDERLNRVLVASGVVVWDWDLDAGRIHCSPNARDFFGFDTGTSQDFLATIHPDDLPTVNAVAERALRTGMFEGLEYRLKPVDGRERWIQARGQVEYVDGRPARMLGVSVEITERRRAEVATKLLADAGEVLGASLDYTTTLDNLARVVVPRLADWFAVHLLREDGTLERASVHHPDPARVAVGKTLFERYPPKPEAAAGVFNVIRTGVPEWREAIPPSLLRAGAQDEEHARLLLGLGLNSYIIVPLIARDTVIGALTLVHAESGRRYDAADVALALDLARRAATAVDNARLHLQLREEDRRKDEFLATLAHELRNPLAPIRTGLALLRMGADEATAARARDVMERQLGHMVRLIDDLLDLSRVTRGAIELQKRAVALGAVVSGAVDASRPLLDAARVRFEADVRDPDVVLHIDDTRIAQVITNLLNNAAKFTPAGGEVRLEAGVADARLRLAVSDTGIGLAPAQLERVFEMFARGEASAAQGGLGIGLTLARRLAELHGGRLWAESAGPGRGSRFVLELPLAQEPGIASTHEARAAESAARAAPQRILVVDDNADAAQTLATLLRMEGHEVRTAGSGGDALAVLDDYRPDLAFLDIGLPGMSGYALARRLRADPRTAHLRLIALTGWGRDEDRRRAREAGFDGHLTKPVAADAVLAALTR